MDLNRSGRFDNFECDGEKFFVAVQKEELF